MKEKIILFVILILTSIKVNAQDPLIYEGVVTLDTVTDEKELIKRLKIWLDEAFVDEKEAVQIMDESEGQLVGKGNLSYVSNIYMGSAGTSGHVNFKMKIQIKTGRYRYEFYDFIHDGDMDYNSDFGLLTNDSICPVHFKGAPKSWCQKVWADIKDQTNTKMQAAIESLQVEMMKPTKMENDTW